MTNAAKGKALKLENINNYIFKTLRSFRNFIGTGNKPAVVYLIDLVFVKKKSLAQGPVTVQAGQQVDAEIGK
jgi:hypothetical protein